MISNNYFSLLSLAFISRLLYYRGRRLCTIGAKMMDSPPSAWWENCSFQVTALLLPESSFKCHHLSCLKHSSLQWHNLHTCKDVIAPRCFQSPISSSYLHSITSEYIMHKGIELTFKVPHLFCWPPSLMEDGQDEGVRGVFSYSYRDMTLPWQQKHSFFFLVRFCLQLFSQGAYTELSYLNCWVSP